jgi:amino acid transporter
MNVEKKHEMGLIGAISYIIGVVGSGLSIIDVITCVFRHLCHSVYYFQSYTLGKSQYMSISFIIKIQISLFIWIFAGVISTFGALSYVELGTAIRTSGADFIYMIHVKWYAVSFAVVIGINES